MKDSNKHSTLFTEKNPNTLAWNVKDVARELKVSVRHIYQLISEGKIPYSKVGRLVRFSPARIREWLDKGGTRCTL